MQFREGARVRVRGAISFYPPRGNTQLVARVVLEAGEGDLAARFAKIRKGLEAEGLLDPARKRPLPLWPKVVGVVTSKTSAAVHDIVRVASERAPMHMVIADCRTTGPEAPRSIVNALRQIQTLPDVEVVILGRGGGSAEELWCFNDERVARAIAACHVPVVCGVGHETDTTIAELVADARASTPSNAAELAIPLEANIRRQLLDQERRLQQASAAQVDAARIRLARLERRIARPELALMQARRRVDGQGLRAGRAVRQMLRQQRSTLESLTGRLNAQDPRLSLVRDRARLERATTALRQEMMRYLESTQRSRQQLEDKLRTHARQLTTAGRAQFAQSVARLHAMSPLRVLERGYAIGLTDPRDTTDETTPAKGEAIRSSEQLAVGDTIHLRFYRGGATAQVTSLQHAPEDDAPPESP